MKYIYGQHNVAKHCHGAALLLVVVVVVVIPVDKDYYIRRLLK
jgi:hypothetical protein